MRFLSEASRLMLNAVLPPQCLACNVAVDSPGNLCASCFSAFTFITPPYCECCGVPLETPVVEDVLCGACLGDRPAFTQARAVFLYTDTSKHIVLKLKHGDRTDAAVALARWMSRAGGPLIDACDIIVPVPLHRWRLLSRMYNQSALLANAIGNATGKPIIPDALARVKATPIQGGLNRAARHKNVARAFAVKNAKLVEGKRVLLIDDVLTTGATASACAKSLLEAGAQSVNVLVVARVPLTAG